MQRRHFLQSASLSFVGFSFAGVPSLNAEIKSSSSLKSKTTDAINQGLKYLENCQKTEGYWSTKDYPGLTALVVQAFLQSPDTSDHTGKTAGKGLEFIRSCVQPDGGI